MKNPVSALACAAALGLVAAATVCAQPPQHPVVTVRPTEPQVRATLTRVRVDIRDGIATTRLVQTLRNDGGRIAEADWILPLPADAVADGFTMTCGGTKLEGEVLTADKARAIYEAIVRRQRDPGLLEYVGCGLLRARVFPIPSNGSVDVEVVWRQILPETAGMHEWTFPLRALGLREQPAEKVSLDVEIRSRRPLKTVWSPLPNVEIRKSDDHQARIGFEADCGQLPERDLQVFYGVSEKDFGLDLLTWRKAGEPGHFLAMVTPKQDWPVSGDTVRVVQFVLDTSGSMQGEKMQQARNALEYFVGSLRPTDVFNVIPFSTEARPFFDAPVAATPENVATARGKIEALEAKGGTNIEEALSLALEHALPEDQAAAGKQAVPITVFLTDGLPTIGQTDVQQLLKVFADKNRHDARVFVFGVGSDVNTRLLDKIAQDTRGDRDYVREGEDIELVTSALFEKLSHPVLTDVRLTFDGIEVFDLEPKRLPDLFKGSRLLVLGRYRGAGHHAIRLTGRIDGEDRELVYEANFAEKASENDFVGTLWAQRRIATLLDAIRLNGSSRELVDEVQRLGREYAIVTPYTSHLVVEEGLDLAAARGNPVTAPVAFFDGRGDADFARRLRADLLRAGGGRGQHEIDPASAAKQAAAESEESKDRLHDLPSASETGATAVTRSLMLVGLARAETAVQGAGTAAAVRMLTHRIGSHTFVLVGGVWVDRSYTAAMKGKERRVVAFSPEYFALLGEHPQLAKVLAFSTRLVVVVDGAAIEIVPAG